MTLPDERARAVVAAQEFLRDLLDAKATPRVPRVIRQCAHRILKHYPHAMHLRPPHFQPDGVLPTGPRRPRRTLV